MIWLSKAHFCDFTVFWHKHNPETSFSYNSLGSKKSCLPCVPFSVQKCYTFTHLFQGEVKILTGGDWQLSELSENST
jgi:hypothetical protein